MEWKRSPKQARRLYPPVHFEHVRRALPRQTFGIVSAKETPHDHWPSALARNNDVRLLDNTVVHEIDPASTQTGGDQRGAFEAERLVWRRARGPDLLPFLAPRLRWPPDGGILHTRRKS